VRATAADRVQSTNSTVTSIAAWLVPGAGHLWLGQTRKGVVFLIAIPLMFATGLWLDGRLFPFEPTQPLVALSAFASIGNGLPYFLAAALGLGKGVVTSATYDYGNTFLTVAGLLNMLVVLDAYDIALGRKG
jgi:hypothetical protein